MMAIPFLFNALANFVLGLLVARFLGPDEFGHYALAISIAVLMQTLGFDWLRLCAVRFYSEKDRAVHPEIRATLDVIFASIAMVGIVVAIGIEASGFGLFLPSTMLVMAVAVAIANGLFEFSAALVRARFANRTYALIVISKNAIAVVLTVGGAWLFGSARIALLGLVLSVGGSLFISWTRLADADAPPRLADRALAWRFASYALPIVFANVLYQSATTMNRGILSQTHDFAQAGQLALAFDMGVRIIGAVGASFDVFLFQVAVRAEKTTGPAAARVQVARNMGILFAIILPSVAGCWLILPSFEHLLIPEAFRGAFGHYFTLVMPAILGFALIQYCIGPAFQIAHRTLPLVVGGCVAALANLGSILLLPASADASRFAIAQSIGAGASFLVMVTFLLALEPMLPRARDIYGAIVGTAIMVLAVSPLRALCPCALTFAETAIGGATIYGLIAFLFDIGDLRGWLTTRLKARATPAAQTAG